MRLRALACLLLVVSAVSGARGQAVLYVHALSGSREEVLAETAETERRVLHAVRRVGLRAVGARR